MIKKYLPLAIVVVIGCLAAIITAPKVKETLRLPQ